VLNEKVKAFALYIGRNKFSRGNAASAANTRSRGFKSVIGRFVFAVNRDRVSFPWQRRE
jgi:hypothetical protein